MGQPRWYVGNMDLLHGLRKIYRPEHFQGAHYIRRKRKNEARYFEGWYFKVVLPDETFAFIPGLSLTRKSEHAFIQVNRSSHEDGTYHEFLLEEFQWNSDGMGTGFNLRIGPNRFSLREIHLELPDLKVDLKVRNVLRWPSSLILPNSMGTYAFARFMDCYHGIIVVDGSVEGRMNGTPVQGSLYVEKDWGISFPRGWVWLQGNDFPRSASLTCSLAVVPFCGRVFNGFIVGLLCGGRIYRFTTYNGAYVEGVDVDATKIRLRFARKGLRLTVEAERTEGVELASPEQGAMTGRIQEALDVCFSVKLESGGREVFAENTKRGAMEVVNPTEVIQLFR